MATNQLLPFANGDTPNVLDYASWNSLPARLTGFQSGIASSQQFNYILAQGGAAGYVIGQLVADYAGQNATLNATALYTAFKQAIAAYVPGSIADKSITTAKLADDAVTSAKLAPGAVNNAALAQNSVGTANVQSNAVTADKIAAGAVGTSELANSSVTTAKINSAAYATQADAEAGTDSVKIMSALRVKQAISQALEGATVFGDGTTIQSSNGKLQAIDVAIGGSEDDLASDRGQIGYCQTFSDVDANTLIKSGFYCLRGQPQNVPNAPQIGFLVVYSQETIGGNFVYQNFIRKLTNSFNCYSRFSDNNGSSWTDWEPILGGNNFSSTSQAEAGTDNSTVMTPLQVRNAANFYGFAYKKLSSIKSVAGSFWFDSQSGIDTSELPSSLSSANWYGIQFGMLNGNDKRQYLFNNNDVYFRHSDVNQGSEVWDASSWLQIYENAVCTIAGGGTGANNAQDALANLGGLPLSGGTLTGNIVINAAIPSYQIQFTDVEQGVIPSSNRFGSIGFLDKNGQRIAFIQESNRANGNREIEICVNNNDNSADARLKVGFNQNTGTFYTSAPTPPTGDSSTNIANTSWAIGKTGDRGALSGYEDLQSQSTALTVNANTQDSCCVTGAVQITVSNGTSGTAWTKTVGITNGSATVSLGSSWDWVGNVSPTITANGVLVLHWCGTFGIANFVSSVG